MLHQDNRRHNDQQQIRPPSKVILREYSSGCLDAFWTFVPAIVDRSLPLALWAQRITLILQIGG
jgi:hypothetical protein